MKKVWSLFSVIIMMICMTACGKQDAELNTEHDHEHEHSAIEGEINLRVGLVDYKGTVTAKAVEQFVEEVESRSNGTVKVTICDEGKLGNEAEMLQQLASNKDTVDIVVADLKHLQKYAKNIAVSSIPFLFEDYDQAKEFMYGEIQEKASEDLTEHNMRALAYYADGFDCILMKNEVIHNSNDLQGLRLAMNTDEFETLIYRKMGVNVKDLSGSEIEDALKQGACNGYEDHILSLQHKNVYQNIKSLVLTNHRYNASGVVISDTFWRNLNEEQQDIIKKAAIQSGYNSENMMSQQEEHILDELESQGVKTFHIKSSSFWDEISVSLVEEKTPYDEIKHDVIYWKEH